MLAAIIEGTSALLVTEGDRRRARLELEQAAGIDGDAARALSVVVDLHARLTTPHDDGDKPAS